MYKLLLQVLAAFALINLTSQQFNISPYNYYNNNLYNNGGYLSFGNYLGNGQYGFYNNGVPVLNNIGLNNATGNNFNGINGGYYSEYDFFLNNIPGYVRNTDQNVQFGGTNNGFPFF